MQMIFIYFVIVYIVYRVKNQRERKLAEVGGSSPFFHNFKGKLGYFRQLPLFSALVDWLSLIGSSTYPKVNPDRVYLRVRILP